MGLLATVGDKDALIIRQEAAVKACDKRGNALVSLIDAHAETVRPKPWWKVWR